MTRFGQRLAPTIVAGVMAMTSGRALASPAPTEAAPKDEVVAPAPAEAPTADAPPPDDAGAPTDETTASEPEPTPEPKSSSRTAMTIPSERMQPTGTRIRFIGSKRDQLELFRLDPAAESEAVGTIDGIPYTRVCSNPCEQPVRLAPLDELFVAGPKLMPSRTFSLDANAKQVDLHVRPGPKRIRFAGFGLTVSGAILIPAGGFVAGAVNRGRTSDIAGFTMIGVGAVALAIGIALIVQGRTLVKARAHR